MYPEDKGSEAADGVEKREWDAWGRPSGGFLDLGCVCHAIRP